MSLDVRLERRLDTSTARSIGIPIVSVLLALVLSAVFLEIEDYGALDVYRELVNASFTTWDGFTDSVVIAIPLVLTGLAAAVTFRMNLFNIGAEGQLYMGAVASSWAALALAPDLPAVLAVLVVLVAGAVGGALWILPAALARAWLGTSEIISTLMLTFIALFFMRYLIFGSDSYWKDPTSTNFPQGKPIPDVAELTRIGDTRVHWGLLVALVAAAVVWVVVKFTRIGYEMTVVGSSPAAARYAGISVRRTILVAMLISGALAGLAGATEVGGRAHALDPNGLELGLGFAGIVVASLARYHPFGVVLVAVLLGGLRNAGLALQSVPGNRVPVEVSLMIQGAILLFAIGGEVFVRNRLVVRRTGRAAPAAGDAPRATTAEAPA